MKIKKEPIREDRYLNLKLDTYPMEFNPLDSIFYDLAQFAYCVMLNDGQQDIVLEYANSKQGALERHKEYYDRMLLRPRQWFDVRNRKFKYVEYKDLDVEEKLTDIKTIDSKSLYSTFISEAQQIVVNGTNNGLTFYTKREATEYSRKVAFSLFSGLRVKIGQLRNTSYAELMQSDLRAVDTFVRSTNKELATRFLNNMYNAGSEEHERWEMFVDLVEAKIAEYYREGNRTTGVTPNYVVLPEIAKEVDERIALTRKPDDGHGSADGPKHAEVERKVKENVAGKFYVDEKCIVCDACAVAAPGFFKLNEQNAFVYKQPTTPEEIDACKKAMEGCPAAAIGDNGDVAVATPAPAATSAAPTNPAVPNAIPVDRTDIKTPENTVVNKDELPVNSTTIVNEGQKDIDAPAVDINDLKALLESVPMDKLGEIKALIQSSMPVQEAAQPIEAVQAPTPDIPLEAPVANGSDAKPLPAISPGGGKVFPENVPGMFYVDDACIECDACVGAAPNSFVIENGHAYVFAQPTNDKEIAECQEAMAGCPVSAIHVNS